MRCVLLVIDVQRGVFESKPPPYEADEVVQRINSLAERARAAGARVVFVQHEHPGSPLQPGAPKWELDPRLLVGSDDVRLRKTTPDVFVRSELAAMLDAWGTQRLVVCGYASEFCVDTTVRRAVSMGLHVVVASDAHTTHDKAHASAARIRAHHNATLPDLGRAFAVPLEAIPSDAISFGS